MTNHEETIDDDPVEFISASRGRGGTNAAMCAISVIADGEAVSVYLSDHVDAAMRDWPGVKVEFGRSIASGRIKSIKMIKTAGGLKIRRYRRQRVKVNVMAPTGTVARLSSGSAGKQSCAGTVDDGGDSVIIVLPATISFEPAT